MTGMETKSNNDVGIFRHWNCSDCWKLSDNKKKISDFWLLQLTCLFNWFFLLVFNVYNKKLIASYLQKKVETFLISISILVIW